MIVCKVNMLGREKGTLASMPQGDYSRAGESKLLSTQHLNTVRKVLIQADEFINAAEVLQLAKCKIVFTVH